LGVAYLLAAGLRSPGLLRAGLLLTLPFRCGAGLFVTVAVFRGALAGPWMAVAAINLGLVAAQGGLLVKGAGRAD
jgi:hypothetical protein